MDESEQRAWRNSCLIVEQTSPDEWALLEWAYRTKQPYRRKDLATLLNNWNCEIQRCREWKNGQNGAKPKEGKDPYELMSDKLWQEKHGKS